MIPLPYKLLGALIVILAWYAAFIGYGHKQYNKGVEATTLTYEAALSKQKQEASTKLIELTGKAIEAERKLQDAKDLQEIKDATNQKTVSDLAALRSKYGRLLDPNAKAGCGGGSGVTKGKALGTSGLSPADRAEAPGLLSTELSDLLWTRLTEADAINNAFASCKADSIKVRE